MNLASWIASFAVSAIATGLFASLRPGPWDRREVFGLAVFFIVNLGFWRHISTREPREKPEP